MSHLRSFSTDGCFQKLHHYSNNLSFFFDIEQFNQYLQKPMNLDTELNRAEATIWDANVELHSWSHSINNRWKANFFFFFYKMCI